MEKRSLNSVVRFGLLATADFSDGFLSLAPAGGFRDASTPHFMKLECLNCGECTIKDVGLYCLKSDTEACCTALFGAKGVKTSCYPTCSNPAHLVRKCKSCGLLGSVEVEGAGGGPGDAICQGEPTLVLHVACMGYKPVSYCPGPGWTARTATGDVVKVNYSNCNFKSCHESTGVYMLVTTKVRFAFTETF